MVTDGSSHHRITVENVQCAVDYPFGSGDRWWWGCDDEQQKDEKEEMNHVLHGCTSLLSLRTMSQASWKKLVTFQPRKTADVFILFHPLVNKTKQQRRHDSSDMKCTIDVHEWFALLIRVLNTVIIQPCHTIFICFCFLLTDVQADGGAYHWAYSGEDGTNIYFF